ncbi:MAG TPA: 50S ribosomal protein L6 [Rhodospirillaceae bacterium]|nr:50S ribosomal protein L6 [Rhodospirillaceae bacterium]
MSRVGKNPVPLAQGVSAEVKKGLVSVKGKLGSLSLAIVPDIEVKLEGNELIVSKRSESKVSQMMWGTTRNNIANMVQGVSEGFKKVLDIEGVGFRVALKGKTLVLQLGFSHEINYQVPEGITIKAPKPTKIEITGFDKQKVGQVAAEIRGMKKPEPYKGKGIRYAGEQVRRKEGKKK